DELLRPGAQRPHRGRDARAARRAADDRAADRRARRDRAAGRAGRADAGGARRLMAGRVLVIGATGTVGSRLVTQLDQRGEKVRAATREPAAARRHSGGTAELVEFDFERPETFAPALDGADRVFLIARPGDEQADRVAVPLIDEMKRQGVRHVVNLTAMGVEMLDGMALRKVERYLEDSGIGFT